MHGAAPNAPSDRQHAIPEHRPTICSVWTACLVLALVVGACGMRPDTAGSGVGEGPVSVAPTLTAARRAHNTASPTELSRVRAVPSDPAVLFPKLPAPPPGAERPPSLQALGRGRLVEVDGCLRLGGDLLLIWPHDYSISTEGEGIAVLDGTGRVVWRVGERAEASGGEMFDLEGWVDVPARCTGPYWVVGSVRPASGGAGASPRRSRPVGR